MHPILALGEEKRMVKKRVEFEAHKTVKLPTNVSFKTKSGEKVRFVAEKPAKVPVHVEFTARKPSR